ncbi:MAG TPA: succinate dehydrogenase/fumarate reductase iron-sulfur subunit [Planctomycetota bacterium]|nr:succinate dehydrogenase/fumarate reductase iron-sulfur subunit [Planctomycetota bacterium]
MNFTLKVWRQKNASTPGKFVTYEAKNISADASFLEMLDIVNNELDSKGEEAIMFDHDCREGICGMCSLHINGLPHGPKLQHQEDPAPGEKPRGRTTCQLYMREFKDGDTIVVEPFRAKAFPIIRDLVVDRSAFDRIMNKGGYISVNTGTAQDANCLPIGKKEADLSMDAAECIACGACVASCKNASAMLFVSAKVSQFALLPQGQPERYKRVVAMVDQMDKEGFGNCTNEGECEANCPKQISLANIARMNRDYIWAKVMS